MGQNHLVFYPLANVPERCLHEAGSRTMFVMSRTGEKNSWGKYKLKRTDVGKVNWSGVFQPFYDARIMCPDVWVHSYGEYSCFGPEKAIGPLMFMTRHELFADLHSDLVKAFGVSRALAMESMALRVIGDMHACRELPLKRLNGTSVAPHVMLMSAFVSQHNMGVEHLKADDIESLNALSCSWTSKIYEWACNHSRDDDTGKLMDCPDPDSVWITVRLKLNSNSTIDHSLRNAMPEQMMQKPSHIVEAVHAGTGTVICVMGDNSQPAKSRTVHRMVDHLKGLGIRVKGAILLNGTILGWINNFRDAGLRWAGIGERQSPAWSGMLNEVLSVINDPKKCPEITPEGLLVRIGENHLPGGVGTTALHAFYDENTMSRGYALAKRRNSMMERCSFVNEHDLAYDLKRYACSYTALEVKSSDRMDKVLKKAVKKAGMKDTFQFDLSGDNVGFPADPNLNFELAVCSKGEDLEFLREAVHVGRRVRFDEDVVFELAAAVHGQTADNEGGFDLTELFSPVELQSLILVNQLTSVFFATSFRTESLSWNYERIAALMGVRLAENRDEDEGIFELRCFEPLDKWPAYLGFDRADAEALQSRCNAFRSCLDQIVSDCPVRSIKCVDQIDRLWSELVCKPLNSPDNDALTSDFVDNLIKIVREAKGGIIDRSRINSVSVKLMQDFTGESYQRLARSSYSCNLVRQKEELTVKPAVVDLSRGGYSSMTVDLTPDENGNDRPGQENIDRRIFNWVRDTCAMLDKHGNWLLNSDRDYKDYRLDAVDDDDDDELWSDSDEDYEEDDEIWSFDDEDDDDDYDEDYDDEDYFGEYRSKFFEHKAKMARRALAFRLYRKELRQGRISQEQYDEHVNFLMSRIAKDIKEIAEIHDLFMSRKGISFQNSVRKYGQKGDKVPYLRDIAVPESAWVNKKTGLVYDRKPDNSPVQSGQRMPRHMRRNKGRSEAAAAAAAASAAAVNGTKAVAIGKITSVGMMRPYPELKSVMPDVWSAAWGPKLPQWKFDELYNVGMFLHAMANPVITDVFLTMSDSDCPDAALSIFDIALDMYARGIISSSPATVSSMQQQIMCFNMVPCAQEDLVRNLGKLDLPFSMFFLECNLPHALSLINHTAQFADLEESVVWITVHALKIPSSSGKAGAERTCHCVMAFYGPTATPLNLIILDDRFNAEEAVLHMTRFMQINNVKLKGIIMGAGVKFGAAKIASLSAANIRIVQMCSTDDELHSMLCSKLGKKSWKASQENNGDMGAVSCMSDNISNSFSFSRAALAVSEYQVNRDLPHLSEISRSCAIKGAGQENIFEGHDLNDFNDRIALFGESFMFTGRPDLKVLQEIGRCAAVAADMLGSTVTFDQGYVRHRVPEVLKGELSSFNPDNNFKAAAGVLMASYWSRLIAVRDYLTTDGFPGGRAIEALRNINLRIIRDENGKVSEITPAGTRSELDRDYGDYFSLIADDLDLICHALGKFFSALESFCANRPCSNLIVSDAVSYLMKYLGYHDCSSFILPSCEFFERDMDVMTENAFVASEMARAIESARL